VERTVNPDVPPVDAYRAVLGYSFLVVVLFFYFVFREQIPIVEWVVLQSENV
jgi:hypothetical protein